MTKPILKLTFEKPRYGYWDGGKRPGGDFHPEGVPEGHPGKDHTITWGCFELNFWFNCGSGRSWREASAIARRRLQHLTKVPATIEAIEGDKNGETKTYQP